MGVHVERRLEIRMPEQSLSGLEAESKSVFGNRVNRASGLFPSAPAGRKSREMKIGVGTLSGL